MQPKALLIEDCNADTVFIKYILEDYYPFTLIDNVTTKFCALQKLGANAYDMVLLDLNLPDTVGLPDIAEIRLKCPQTPLIIITGSCSKETINAACKYRADGIIDKSNLVGNPFQDSLEEALQNVTQIS